MSEELISYLKSSLADTGDDVATFQWLSDEETAAIERPDESELTVQPWIEAQDDVDANVSARFGERSLFMRGLLVGGVDAESGEPGLVATDDLRFVIDARRLGVAYILARAVERGQRSARNNVLQSQVGSFEEDIDDEGMHVFSACTYRTAAHRFAEWALPTADHAGITMRTRISTDRWERWIVNEFGVDVRALEVNVFLPGTSGTFEPETWLLAEGYEAAVLAVPTGESMEIASMTQGRLAQRLCERIAMSLGVHV